MKSLFIISLIVCFFEINAVFDECSEYRPVNDIKECIGKETLKPHFGCCGQSIINPYYS